MIARIRQDGERWWVARPRMSPEPPLETPDAARVRAINAALWGMPVSRR
jgi:hypothetical protein